MPHMFMNGRCYIQFLIPTPSIQKVSDSVSDLLYLTTAGTVSGGATAVSNLQGFFLGFDVRGYINRSAGVHRSARVFIIIINNHKAIITWPPDLS